MEQTCSQCGAAFETDDEFCGGCGAPRENRASRPAPPMPASPQTGPSPGLGGVAGDGAPARASTLETNAYWLVASVLVVGLTPRLAFTMPWIVLLLPVVFAGLGFWKPISPPSAMLHAALVGFWLLFVARLDLGYDLPAIPIGAIVAAVGLAGLVCRHRAGDG